MTSFDHHECISLRQAAKILPGNPTRSTLSRWAHNGVRGVRLTTILIGGRRYTSRKAIDQFVAALSNREGTDVA